MNATLTRPRAPDWLSHHRTLAWTLGFSFALHLALLTFRIAAPETFNRVFENTPLEVILVNARSDERPSEAQALAQVRLNGGGEVMEVMLSSSPLPPSPESEPGTELSEMQRKIEALKTQQMRLLSQLKEELDSLSREDPGDKFSTKDKLSREERRQQLSRHLSQIEQRVQETQGAPRKRYISPATKEVVYAIYYDKLRHAIEQRGTQNFPEAAGQKLYGKLTMAITVDQQGRLVQAEVISSSGNPLLDERARAIVQSATPFDAFDAKMKRQADQIVIISRFKFSRDDTLQTRVLAPDKE